MLRRIGRALVVNLIEPLLGHHRPNAAGIVGLAVTIGGFPAVKVKAARSSPELKVDQAGDAIYLLLVVNADEPTVRTKGPVTPIPGSLNFFRIAEGGMVTVIGIDGSFRDTDEGHEGVELRTTRSLDGTLVIAQRTLAGGEACELIGCPHSAPLT